MRAIEPLPVSGLFAPTYLRNRPGAYNRDFAFNLRDPEGMPNLSGTRVHGAVDWFAPAGHVIRAPGDGVVVEARESDDHNGGVYGGVLKIRQDDGLIWSMRHVDPAVGYGSRVAAGEVVARVFDWHDGGDHLHLEIWKTGLGGYRQQNMIDPASVTWIEPGTAEPEPVTEPPAYYFEELPASLNGRGPDVVGVYDRSLYAMGAATLRRARGELVSTVAGSDGKFYVLRWAPGTYGQAFRFGPWANAGHRDATQIERERNQSRPMRPFATRERSLYPWPLKG